MKFKCLFFSLMVFFSFLDFGFTQELKQPLMVRLIYFLPSDRIPQPDIDTKMDAMIKDVQQFFADVMESHGFDRKTFMFETDATGQAIVHHVNGQFADAYYHQQIWGKVENEIDQHFDTSRSIHLIAIDISQSIFHTILPDGDDYATCGMGTYYGAAAGGALIPASDQCFAVDVAAHELGHAFGLKHDRRPNPKIIPVQYNSEIPNRTSADPMLTSFCAAERLDVHPLFNANRQNQDVFNQTATVKMLSPRAAPPHAIRLRFTVTDADGLHQARLLVGTFQDMVACKTSQGKSRTVEFVTDLLTPEINEVILEVIDINGNSTIQTFPIDIVPLLPTPEAVLIPDLHLAAAVRETLGLVPDSVITTHAMLDLYDLLVSDRQITDLTGLEYARNLQWLKLGSGVYGSPSETVNSNRISDLSPIAGLTNLRTLWLSYCYVSDLSELGAALGELTQLVDLGLNGNAISDVAALGELTQLEYLSLSGNAISDVAALGELTQLKYLSLSDNAISDVSAFSNLTRMESLYLDGNSVSDISALANLAPMRHLFLSGNRIRDIAPLAKLENLTILRLGGNPIVDRTPLQTLLQHNPGLDVDIGSDPPANLNVQEIELEGSITGPWLWIIAPTPAHQGGAASTNVDSLAAASSGAVTEADIAENGANQGDTVGDLVWTLAEIHNTGTFLDLSNNVTDVVHRIGWAEGDVNHHSSYALITLDSATDQENVMMRVGSDDSIKVWLNGKVVHDNPVNRGSSNFQDFFRVHLNQGDNLLLVKVSEATGNWSMFVGIDAEVTAIYKPPVSVEPVVPAWDVNEDGTINVLDLALVAQYFGETDFENPRADVNSDGIVNILDLALVAKHFGV